MKNKARSKKSDVTSLQPAEARDPTGSDISAQLQKNLVKHLLFQDFSGCQFDSLRIPMDIIQEIDIQIPLVVFLRFLSPARPPERSFIAGPGDYFYGIPK
jgi:hypothetical protein